MPEFDKTSFELDEGELSKPVKTQYGYHVIEAVSPVTTRDDDAARQGEGVDPRDSCSRQKKSEVMTDVGRGSPQEYEDKVSYAAGFEPPEIPEAPTETE